MSVNSVANGDMMTGYATAEAWGITATKTTVFAMKLITARNVTTPAKTMIVATDAAPAPTAAKSSAANVNRSVLTAQTIPNFA